MARSSAAQSVLARSLAGALLLSAITACAPPAAPPEPNSASGDTGTASAPAAGTAAASPVADFALADLNGTTVRLSDFAGKVRLVDFWATWCAPCREEIPMFEELHRKYGPRGFTMIAISRDEGGASVVAPFVAKQGTTYLNLIGTDEVADAFGGVAGLPTAFLLDGEGRVVERFFGPKPRRVLEGKIEQLLSSTPAPTGAQG